MGSWHGPTHRAESEQEGQAVMLRTFQRVLGFQLSQEKGVVLCKVAPFSQGQHLQRTDCPPRPREVHPSCTSSTEGDLENAEDIHDNKPKVFILLGPLWTSHCLRLKADASFWWMEWNTETVPQTGSGSWTGRLSLEGQPLSSPQWKSSP